MDWGYLEIFELDASIDDAEGERRNASHLKKHTGKMMMMMCDCSKITRMGSVERGNYKGESAGARVRAWRCHGRSRRVKSSN